MIPFHKITRWGMMVLALAVVGLAGCSEDDEGNKAPVVTITASETSTTMGNSVELIAVATDAEGDALLFTWSADTGTFDATDDDTVNWTAPETEEIVTLSLRVTDDINSTLATVDIGVGVYVPTVQPYYLGAAACSGCHSATHTDWATTAHATAYDRKIDELAAYCMRCHTVGHDATVDNGGWDENPVYGLTGIQCENCHGPASAHVASMDAADLTPGASLDPYDSCATCHESTRQTNWSDWEASAHGSMTPRGGYGGSCSVCHTGNGFIEFAATGATGNTYDAAIATAITCITCHDPHDDTNPHLLRKLTASTPGGTAITEGGYGILCMNCHNGRRTPADVATKMADGDEHFGPHHGVQGAVLVQDPDMYIDMAGGTFTFQQTGHLNVEDSCVTCHMQGHGPLNANGYPAVMPHAFEVDEEACEPCHGVIADFDDIMANYDYDGDSTVEGVQSEVAGLLTWIETALYATGLDTTGFGDIYEVAGFSTDSTAVWAGVNTTTYPVATIRGATWNALVVEDDLSHGVHNAAFTIKLLQQSYLALTGNPIPGGYMMQPGER
jgi:hypothetical protein